MKAKGKKVTYAPAINMDAEARLASAFTPVTPRKKGELNPAYIQFSYYTFQ